MQVTSEKIRHCPSTSFAWWWTPPSFCSASPGAARDDQQRHLLGVGAGDRVHDVVAAGAVGDARRRRAGACCARSRRRRSRPTARGRSVTISSPRLAAEAVEEAEHEVARAGRRCGSRRRASDRRPGSRRAPCAAASPTPGVLARPWLPAALQRPASPGLLASATVERRHHEGVVDPALAQQTPELAAHGNQLDERLLEPRVLRSRPRGRRPPPRRCAAVAEERGVRVHAAERARAGRPR